MKDFMSTENELDKNISTEVLFKKYIKWLMKHKLFKLKINLIKITNVSSYLNKHLNIFKKYWYIIEKIFSFIFE